VVESYNYFTKRKKDLFHIFDILAIGNGETVGVQITSKSNMSSRIKKISESEFLPELLNSKWRILVLGWYKQPNGRYACKEFEF
jgi:16S rRNA U1498 N3-methylase RsmE